MSTVKPNIQFPFVQSRLIKVALFLLIVSYFYNLPVVKYSLTGNNEFRLYDVVGLVILGTYIKYFKAINLEINRIVFFKKFRKFAVYCAIMITATLIFSIFRNKIVWFIQTCLYLYHMWVFFLGAFLIYCSINTVKKYKRFVYLISTLVILEGLLVLLQQLQIVPFLWSREYAISYHSFLSGTLGPNKIVLGMTMLIAVSFLISVLFLKPLKIFRPYIYAAIGIAFIVILLSGSRTTYVAGIVFLTYFLFRNMGRIVQISFYAVIGFLILLYTNPEIIELIDNTIQGRIVNKIKGPEDINTVEDFTGVYEDLGAGRNYLHKQYVIYLAENPYIIPFGIGLNNRLMIGFSAHNQYLSLINEVGLIGLYFFLSWLLSYITIVKKALPSVRASLNGLIFAMIVSLYFGEHLYIYRPLFALLGLFLLMSACIVKPLTFLKKE